MAASYGYSLDREAVAALLEGSGRERQLLVDACERISQFPFSTGDFVVRDEDGREVELLDVGEFVITFWSDHAVKTVRILSIERV
ncbi:MAG TPA: hypothetical protein VMM36_07975 [Opitutaceae bacterium]|nr:hypothetical protein [Opitutaceae bacterium]